MKVKFSFIFIFFLDIIIKKENLSNGHRHAINFTFSINFTFFCKYYFSKINLRNLFADILFVILSTSDFYGAKYVPFQRTNLSMFPLEEKKAIIRRDLWKKSDYLHKFYFSIFKRHKYKTAF